MKLHSFLANQTRVIFFMYIINNGNGTEWSPIRSVTIRVINREAGVRFVNQKYDYR